MHSKMLGMGHLQDKIYKMLLENGENPVKIKGV
jgi:hypothetical protein